MMIFLSGCNKQGTGKKTEDSVKGESNILVAYFSRTGENYSVGDISVGNTAIVAGYMAEHLNADIYEIVPTIAYPHSYEETLTVTQNERVTDARPAFNNHLTSLEEYDTIFIGYPIWWGTFPQIIYSFLDEYDFSGKTIYPFCTHEGSGLSTTTTTLQNYLPTAVVKEGFAMRGSVVRNNEAKTTITEWLEQILK